MTSILKKIDRKALSELAGYNEDLYGLYSETPFTNRKKAIIDSWFRQFPSEDQARLKGEFNSENINKHNGALLELFSHHFFKVLDFRIIKNEGKRLPDFQVEKDRYSFFIECTAVRSFIEASPLHDGSEQVKKVLNQLDSPYFFDLLFSAKGQANLRERELRRFTEQLINDKKEEKYYRFFDNGWDIEISLKLKFDLEQSNNVRSSPLFLDHETENFLIRSLKKKTPGNSRFSNEVKGFPYIIALNSLEVGTTSRDSVFKALFEKFWSPSKNTSVSGVILFDRLIWSSIEEPEMELWHNPWAASPLDRGIIPINQVYLDPHSPVKKENLVFEKRPDSANLFSKMVDDIDVEDHN